jgi:hypothetical protein
VVHVAVRASFGTGRPLPLHLALGEATAHMPAVAIDDVEFAFRTAEYDQLLSEGVDGVRLSVAALSGQPKAVPAAGESGGGRLGFDLPNVVGVTTATSSPEPSLSVGCRYLTAVDGG